MGAMLTSPRRASGAPHALRTTDAEELRRLGTEPVTSAGRWKSGFRQGGTSGTGGAAASVLRTAGSAPKLQRHTGSAQSLVRAARSGCSSTDRSVLAEWLRAWSEGSRIVNMARPAIKGLPRWQCRPFGPASVVAHSGFDCLHASTPPGLLGVRIGCALQWSGASAEVDGYCTSVRPRRMLGRGIGPWWWTSRTWSSPIVTPSLRGGVDCCDNCSPRCMPRPRL